MDYRTWFLSRLEEGWVPTRVVAEQRSVDFQCRHPDHEVEHRAFLDGNGERREFALCLKCQILKETT